MAAGENGGGRVRKTPKQWKPVHLPRELYEAIGQAAEENQRSLAGECRYALTLYVRSQERRRAAAQAQAAQPS